jgi:hypothetical protein
MLFLEHCNTVTARWGNMLPYAEAVRRSGFRTVYAFSEEDAKTIKESRNSRGFSRFIPSSVELFIDLDSPEFLEEAQRNIEKLGWRYSLWTSGSKGYHIHIPHNLSSGYGLPSFHKDMALQVSPNADVSLYRNNSLFRLPGTIHAKTGRPKTLIKTGGVIAPRVPFECAGEPETNEIKFAFGESDESELSLALGAIQGFLKRQPGEGRRYQTLWSIGKGLADGGLSNACTRELLEVVNNSWPNPKEESEIERCLRDVFKL